MKVVLALAAILCCAALTPAAAQSSVPTPGAFGGGQTGTNPTSAAPESGPAASSLGGGTSIDRGSAVAGGTVAGRRGARAGSANANNVTSAASAASDHLSHWVLCPPPGASGTQPFLDGTDLSCAP